MALGGWDFHISPAEVDENLQKGESPKGYVLRLAESKVRTCTASMEKGLRTNGEKPAILAADTTVVDGDAILGKPVDNGEAMEMLRRLRGRTHQVYTALAVMRMNTGNLITDLCVTDVPMRAYRDDEMDAYVASGDPLDKAGAYAIQHPEFHPVQALSGCYASVMGLPLCHLARTLKQVNIASRSDLPAACQSYLNYQCPISAAVLCGEQVG